MLSVQLAQLIERHADSLTHEVVEDLLSNAHTISDVNMHAPELQKAAADCVKKWRFKPVQIDGYAVEVESEFAIAFSAI